MKKAYSLLIVIGMLALLDGTPVHNHHGKYISNRNKASVQESNDHLLDLTAISDPVIVNDFNDDDNLETIVAHKELNSIHQDSQYSRIDYFNFLIQFHKVPRYITGCDYRI